MRDGRASNRGHIPGGQAATPAGRVATATALDAACTRNDGSRRDRGPGRRWESRRASLEVGYRGPQGGRRPGDESSIRELPAPDQASEEGRRLLFAGARCPGEARGETANVRLQHLWTANH